MPSAISSGKSAHAPPDGLVELGDVGSELGRIELLGVRRERAGFEAGNGAEAR